MSRARASSAERGPRAAATSGRLKRGPVIRRSSDRRGFIAGATSAGALAIATAAAGSAPAEAAERTATGHIDSATAITKVFGEGQKLVAIAAEYDQDIADRALSTSTFTVPDRSVVSTYTSDHVDLGKPARAGRHVIVELSPDDAAALLWVQLPSSGGMGGPPQVGDSTPGQKILPASATITQVGALISKRGRRWAPAARRSRPAR